MVSSILSAFTSSIDAIDLRLLGTLLIKGTAVLVVVCLAAAALRRRSAGTRHVVWSAGLAAILALPLAPFVVPWRLEVLPTSAVVLPSGASLVARPGVSVTEAAARAADESFRASSPRAGTLGGEQAEEVREAPRQGLTARAETGVAGPGGDRSAGSARAARAEDGRREAAWDWIGDLTRRSNAELVLGSLFMAWVIGVLVLLARVCGGALRVQRVTRRGTALESADWMKPLWEAADRLDLTRVPRLFMSDGVQLPFACGLVRPAIVVPAAAADWTDERRRAVLFHELGHVRRLDLLSHLVGRLACALYWFHPLVWLAARRARAESERACDDLVLSTGTRPSTYAEHLLQIACGAANTSAPVVAIPMAQRREFEGRMVAILEPDLPRQGPSRVQAAMLAGSVAVLALAVAAMAPIRAESREDGTPSASSTADAPSEVSMAEPTSNPAPDADAAAAERASVSVTPVSDGRAEPPELLGASAQPRQQPPAQEQPQQARQDALEESPQEARQETSEQARAVAALAGALRDPVVDVRLAAAHGLGEIGDSAAVAALSEALRTDAVAEVRSTAAWALGEIGDPAAVPALSAAVLEDEDVEVRRQAAWALGEIEDASAVGALGTATSDADPTVAEMAIWALAEIDSPDAAPYLAPALQSPHAEIRRRAVWALAETEAQAAVEPLIAALEDEDVEVRSQAAWGLGEIEDLRAVPALAAALGDASPEVRRQAVWALGELEPSSAPGALYTALRDADQEVRQKAAWALGEIADPASAEALTAALADSSAEVRRTAFWALGEMGGPIAQEALLEAIRSEDPEIRKMAAQALARSY
ncbi:MAG: HEAT repeat domain-containing protein [Longimicrobiales bacterium]